MISRIGQRRGGSKGPRWCHLAHRKYTRGPDCCACVGLRVWDFPSLENKNHFAGTRTLTLNSRETLPSAVPESPSALKLLVLFFLRCFFLLA